MQLPRDRLNQASFLFLVGLMEPVRNSLELTVLEASPEPQEKDTQILPDLVVPMRAVKHQNNDGQFRLYWPEYTTYQVCNEMYRSLDDDHYQIFEGNSFRIFTKSRFFEALYPNKNQLAFANQGIKHFQIRCEFHIIDVLAEGEPNVQIINA